MHFLQGDLVDTLPAPYGDEMRGINETVGLPLGEKVHNICVISSHLTEKLCSLSWDIDRFPARVKHAI